MNGTEMQTSYCSKNCDECKEKIEGKCPGCKKGPGGIAARGKICQLAQCCRDNNINSCVDCPTKDICANYQSRDLQPEYREKRNADKQNREDLRTYKRKQISNKFLNFWLIVLWAGTVFQAIPFVLSFGLPLLMGIIKVFSDVVIICFRQENPMRLVAWG